MGSPIKVGKKPTHTKKIKAAIMPINIWTIIIWIMDIWSAFGTYGVLLRYFHKLDSFFISIIKLVKKAIKAN